MRAEGNGSLMKRSIVAPRPWQVDYGFVPAIAVSAPDRLLVCSGQSAVDGDGRPIQPGNMRAQITAALDSLEETLASAGFRLANVVRLRWYTTDVDCFLEAADVYVPRLDSSGCRCVTSLLGVTRLTFPESLVEVEATAVD
jgi:enamine deaminase RidA (YjgF/YER057c/UK114 family)